MTGELSGAEPLVCEGREVATVLEFWRWAASDLLSNTLRGLFAEFIVAKAVGAEMTPRREWDPYDLVTPSGTTLEVKSAAYVQTWTQTKPSTITFGIAPTRAWNYDTAKFSPERRRQADLYIFCLLTERDRNLVDPLNLDQWRFYIVPTPVLNERFPDQKSISLSTLEALGIEPAGFGALKQALA